MQAVVELNEIQVSEDVEKNSIQFGKLILESVMIHNPDILITESTIGKYTLVTNSKFALLLLYQEYCPVIVVRDSTMPLVSFVTHLTLKVMGNLGPAYLVRLMSNKVKEIFYIDLVIVPKYKMDFFYHRVLFYMGIEKWMSTVTPTNENFCTSSR